MSFARSAVASTSRATAAPAWSLRALAAALPAAAPFSTSAPAGEKRHRRTARLRKRRNEDAQELKARLLEATRPDPVRGHQMNDGGRAAWQRCELAQVVLQKDAVWGVKEDRRGNLVAVPSTHADDAAAAEVAQRLGGPLRLNFGLGAKDRELLFRDLPAVQVEDSIFHDYFRSAAPDMAAAAAQVPALEAREEASAETLKRILDLRNASGRGIQAENIRRIVGHFGKRVGAPPDTGSPEVQGECGR
jgi:small subunit ribosomal protein S15